MELTMSFIPKLYCDELARTKDYDSSRLIKPVTLIDSDGKRSIVDSTD